MVYEFLDYNVCMEEKVNCLYVFYDKSIFLKYYRKINDLEYWNVIVENFVFLRIFDVIILVRFLFSFIILNFEFFF